MNTKNVIWGLVGLGLILGLIFPRNGGTVVERVVEKTIGAVATLDGVDNGNVSINGLREFYYSQSMVATSSVVCSIRNPLAASSTLDNYGVKVNTNGIAVAQWFDVSTSTSASASGTTYGSSSPALIRSLATPNASAGPFSVNWTANGTTTNTRLVGMSNNIASSSDVIIGPNEFVNLRIATTSAGTFSSYWSGTCSGVFRKI